MGIDKKAEALLSSPLKEGVLSKAEISSSKGLLKTVLWSKIEIKD